MEKNEKYRIVTLNNGMAVIQSLQRKSFLNPKRVYKTHVEKVCESKEPRNQPNFVKTEMRFDGTYNERRAKTSLAAIENRDMLIKMEYRGYNIKPILVLDGVPRGFYKVMYFIEKFDDRYNMSVCNSYFDAKTRIDNSLDSYKIKKVVETKPTVIEKEPVTVEKEPVNVEKEPIDEFELKDKYTLADLKKINPKTRDGEKCICKKCGKPSTIVLLLDEGARYDASYCCHAKVINPDTVLYIAQYKAVEGGYIRGNWKYSLEEIDQEISQYERSKYKRIHRATAKITMGQIEKIALECNCTISEVFSSNLKLF